MTIRNVAMNIRMKMMIVLAMVASMSSLSLNTLAQGQVITGAAKATPSITQRDLDKLGAVIKSRDDLARYMAYMPDSPINKLPVNVKNHFLNSLVFTQAGLGSYSYIDLRDYLNVSEVYQVLSLFGEQHSLGVIPGLHVTNVIDQAIYADAVKSANPIQTNNATNANFGGHYQPMSQTDYVCDGGNGPEHCVYSFGSVCGDQCGSGSGPGGGGGISTPPING